MPTTAGMPSSRAMIAAWQVRPPRLVTMAAARFMIGSQSGSVMSATSTSPGRNVAISSGEREHPHRAGADLLADRPALDEQVTPLGQPVTREVVPADCRDFTVSGRACRMYSSTVPAVQAPLDVHRPPVVLLDGQRLPGQRLHLAVGQAQPPLLGRRPPETNSVVRPTSASPV